jgi:hypothetical protein
MPASLVLPFLAHLLPAPQAPIDLLAVTPADALVVVSTDRFDAIRERATKSVWANFFRDERLGLDSMISMALERGEAQEHWDLGHEVLATIHGGLTAFLVPLANGHDVGGCVLLQPEEGLELFLGHFDRFVAKVEAEGGTVHSMKSYAGVELDVFEEQDGGDGVAVFESHGVVGVAAADEVDAALDIAYGMIDRIGGQDGSPGIGASADFAAARGAGGRPVIEVHLQVQELIRASNADSTVGEEGGSGVSQEPGFPAKAGLDQVRWVHGKMDIGAGEELDFSLSAHVPRGTFVGAIADRCGPLPKELLKRLPSEGTGVSLMSFDVAGLWQDLRDFLRQHYPDALAELETSIQEGEQEMGFDVEELIGALDGRFASHSMRLNPEDMPEMAMFGGEGEVPEALLQSGSFFVGYKRTDVLQSAVQKLLEKMEMAPMVQTESFLGSEVHTLEMGFINPRWSFLADGIVVSMHAPPMRAFLRQATPDGGPSAEADARFADAVGSFGTSSALGMSTTANAIGNLLGMAQMASMFAYGLVENPDEIPLLSNPPDPSMAAEYFKGLLISGLRREGDRIELFLGAR